MNKFNKIKKELRDKYKNNLVINFSPASSFRARCEFSYKKNQYVMHNLNKKIYINKFNDAKNRYNYNRYPKHNSRIIHL